MDPDMRDALELVEENDDLADFAGPRDEGLVVAAEALVRRRFPTSYRTFLLELGMGDFAGEEFAGIIDDRFEELWPDAVGMYLKDVRDGLPPRYFPFHNWGDGTVSALDLDRRDDAGESPVVACHDGLFRSQAITDEASSFGAFFLERLRSALD
jgi:antitoxin YobK